MKNLDYILNKKIKNNIMSKIKVDLTERPIELFNTMGK